MLIDSLLNTPIEEFFDRPPVKIYPKNSQGVEVELEFTEGVQIKPSTYWRIKGDGSLRHFGVEFIFKEPISNRAGMFKAFEELES